MKPQGRKNEAAPRPAARASEYAPFDSPPRPSRRPSPRGSVGDQVAIRGDRPVRRVPRIVITIATATISTAVTWGGIVMLAPTAPSNAPNTA